jgi:hypothetical protein
MEITRRRFLCIVLPFCAWLAAYRYWRIGQPTRGRCTRALPSSGFPGRLEPFDDAGSSQHSKWSG